MSEKDISHFGRWNLYQVEIIERFSWSALAGIMVAYLMAVFSVDYKFSYLLYSGTSGMTYAIMVLGGRISDIFGAKRIVYIGLFTKSIGFLVLALSTHIHMAVIALSIICVGIGLFKAAPSALLAQVTKEGDEDKNFTALYMSINLGALIAKLVLMLIAFSYMEYITLFWISTISSFLVLVTFYLMRHTLGHISTSGGAKSLNKKYLVSIALLIPILCFFVSIILTYKTLLTGLTVLVGILAIIYLVKLALKTPSVWAVIALMFIIAPFNIVYVQLYTSFLTEAKANIGPIFGQFVLVLNPLTIVVFGAIFLRVYKRLSIHNFYKMALGTALIAISCFIISNWTNAPGLFLTYITNAIGELLVSAIGLGVVARYMPKDKVGTGTGIYFLFLAIWNIAGGYIATFTVDYSTQAIASLISATAIGVAFIIFVSTYFITKHLKTNSYI
ncbi:MFS transporter [Thiotrichales bacterium 19S11-10]|nr:MFS transporter [Thiotrichales bacterium 19S11-10]MCF6808395.1 MFS transporter [Thiotrichales bacterium 19S9-11]MCF6812365.1 MFS transporter [Thiotrichales bacterium 19S9-12]